jgi:hypothetical protein
MMLFSVPNGSPGAMPKSVHELHAGDLEPCNGQGQGCDFDKFIDG